MPKRLQQNSAALNRKLIAVAVASCFTANFVLANPTLPTVVHGAATIHQTGNLLQVTNSPNAIINWGSFSINASEITRFIQQSAASSVLNRVIGQDPSAILGALQSNGRVFLINPNGILFGAGAQIDVAGLVASTLNLSNADFLAGRMRFSEVPGAGSVVNQGAINAAQGGSVYLVAPDVANSGIITSPKGEVILAAGKSVELVNPGTPNLRVEIVATDNVARNLGQIMADSGRIGIYAGLINHGGSLRADTVEVGKNGEILLKANKNITLEPGSVISASGAPGGVHGGGTVRIVAEDTLDMRRGSAVHVDGGIDGGDGGFLELSGMQRIALNGEYTGRARKEGYKHGSLLLDPLNINIGTLGITTTISLASNPGSIVVKQDGTRVYVVRPNGSSSDSLEVIDTSTNAIIATVNLGDGSNALVTGMALSPDGTRLYAVFGNTGSSAGFIQVVDTTSNSVVTTYGVSGPTNLFGTVVDSSNRIYVLGNVPFSIPSAAQMVVIDGATGAQLDSVAVGFNPQTIIINPAGTRVYVTSVFPNVVLQEFATGTNTLLSSTPLTARPNDQTISADGSTIYLAYSGRIEARSTATMAVVDTIPIGADGLVVNGSSAYASLNGGVSVIDLTTKTAKQTFVIGTGSSQILGFNTANNSIYANATANQVAVIGLSAGTDTTTGGAIAHTDAPGATLNLPVSALSGAWTNVSLAATNNVSVNSPLVDSSVPSGGTLTLTAGNDVNINAWIGEPTARFNHALTLTAGNNVNINSSIYQGNQPLVLAADAAIPAQGITPNASGNVNIKALGAPVTVDTLGSMTVTGQDFNILGGRSAGVTVNVGGVLDANLAGNFTLQGGSASAGIGDTVNASAMVQANSINIVAAGAITIAGGDSVDASGCCVGDNGVMGGTAITSVNSNASMTATTSINLTASSITIRGGDNGTASACCNGMSGGTGIGTATLSANATVAAGTTLVLTAPTVTIRGGDDAYASACCNGEFGPGNGIGTAVINANANVSAVSNLTINTTTLTIRGGDNGSASACCNGTFGGVGAATATSNANATVTAGQDLIINATGAITIAGGNFASASACCNGSNGNGSANVTVNANALVSAGRHVNLTGASLTVRGGDSAEASACCNGSSGNGGATAVVSAKGSLIAGQDMTLNVSGPVIIRGGDNASASACCNGLSAGGVGNTNVSADIRAVVTAGGILALNSTSLEVRGGDGAYAGACCNGTSGGNGIATVATNATALLSTPQNMMLNVTGPVVIRGGDNAGGSACCNGSGIASIANINVATDVRSTVSAGGTLSVTATGLTVRGGDSAFGSAGDNGSFGGYGVANVSVNASALLSAGPSLIVNTGAMTIRGGNFSGGSVSDNGGLNSLGNLTLDVNATVLAAGNISLSATGLTVSGGTGASVDVASNAYAGTAISNANAQLNAGQAMTLAITGPMLVAGGDNVYASARGAGQNTATANADATILAGTTLTVTGVTGLTLSGGIHSSSFQRTEANGAGLNAATTRTNASIWAMDFSYTGGPVSLLGGVATTLGGAGANTAIAEANAVVMGAGSKFFNISGDLIINGGQALDTAAAPNFGGAMARAILDPGTLDVISSGDVMLTGGTVTGIGSAYSSMLATGPISVTVGGTAGLTLTGGASGTGIVADPGIPITVTFTGGGTQNLVNNPSLDGASIQTTLFIPPPPPPPPPSTPLAGEPAPIDLTLVNQVLIKSVNESGSTAELQQASSAEGPTEQAEKKKENEAPVCR